MKSVMLFIAGCLFTCGASAKYYDIASLETLKGFDPTVIAGKYKGKNGDTASVEVVAVNKDGAAAAKKKDIVGYNIDINYSKNLIPDYTLDRYVGGSDLIEVSKKGSFLFSRETECDDVECSFGTDDITFYKKDGKYVMDAVIDYNSEESRGFGWEYEDADGEPLPDPAEADILDYCKTIYGPTATGSFNDDVFCQVTFESKGLVQQ
jgi:hypothetical protein